MSTPPDPEQPPHGPALEPVRVLRLRRFDALAELMREMRQDAEGAEGAEGYEAVAKPRWRNVAEDETQELPPLGHTRHATPADGRFGFGTGLRRAGVVVAVTAAALAGFGCALLLPGRGDAATAAPPAPPSMTAPTTPSPAATATVTAATDPDGPGTLRQGDSGPEVTELQQRLLAVPDVYRGGSADGHYDTVLTEAVARFQLWYGISGDETGVYGNDTRRALESRTSLDGG
ncbi:peptidoglycan-binding domain-containing protein [Streptomyces herbicida]|uniref:peptidoglycan-binding domain-containing protein n=1 Tax=Streptomyces herbicida TaxID=3065675 RepID=UPI00292DEA2E|nr:peptidoglycan-binding domain-containing protein [Streptomyces sp. NEAU-HV9]